VVVDGFGAFAAARGATPAQVALAWLLAQADWIVPIPGTTKVHRLEENLGAVDLQLSSEERQRIAQALDEVSIVGERYNAQRAAQVKG
jgi:aryl-alcohol dehydrogenase-like predicted oxidoreductase